MNWCCKICKFETPRKTELLKHYRLRHVHSGQFLPCLYWECYCSSKHGPDLNLICQETQEDLERQRLALFTELKKRNNSQIINEKMERTFSICRQEVVAMSPAVHDLKECWPALFLPAQVNVFFLFFFSIYKLAGVAYCFS